MVRHAAQVSPDPLAPHALQPPPVAQRPQRCEARFPGRSWRTSVAYSLVCAALVACTDGTETGSLQGEVLPGAELRSQVVGDLDIAWNETHPEAPRYPKGWKPDTKPRWSNVSDLTEDRRIYATDADARFNAEDARYQIAYHLSHYGGMPDSAGDFNGDGVEDFMNMSHFAYVDGMRYAGEVHIWFGRKDAHIDPKTQYPDVLIYGDQAGGKLGISVASAGDFNADGTDDIMMSAGFRTNGNGGKEEAGTEGGAVYVLLGGSLDLANRPVKVRIQAIGNEIPGLVLLGGHDGARYTGWANALDSGDFNGDGVSDIVTGAYNPYPSRREAYRDFDGRAYLFLGGRDVPERLPGYRLGIDGDVDGMRGTVLTVPNRDWTRGSLGFGVFFLEDISGDGRDELAFGTGRGGPSGRGAVYIFWGRADGLPSEISIAEADLVIDAGDEHERAGVKMQFAELASARPAGDVNGDGIDDALITARYSKRSVGNSMTMVGAVGVLFGSEELVAKRTQPFSELPVVIIGERHGWIGQPAMDRGGDIDGDGYADILVNDPYYRESISGSTPQYRGRVWMVRGGASMAPLIHVESDAHRVFLPDTRIPGMFGFTWTTGDWNGDGKLDVVIGDHYAGDSQRNEHRGITYLFYNGSAMRP